MPPHHRISLALLLGTSLVFAADLADPTKPERGPYATLSEAAKQRLRDRYEDLAPDDEPPYPLEGTEQLYRELTEIIPKIGADGTLFAAVEVDETGKATAVTFHSLPNSLAGITEAEVRQLYALPLVNTRYKPALCKGKPCAMAWPFSMEITMTKVPKRPGPDTLQRR